MTANPLRSVLFAPGSDERKLEKLKTLDADLVVLDLEDAVAPTEKERARELVARLLPTFDRPGGVAARVNGADTPQYEADRDAVVVAGLDYLFVPKVEDADVLTDLAAALGRLEGERGLPAGRLKVIPLIESAKALVRLDEIAAAAPRRVHCLAIGTADLQSDLGAVEGEDGTELLYVRSRVVVASRAAGLAPPLDGPYLSLEDDEGLVAASMRSRRLGLGGRITLHPRQIPLVNRGYAQLTPHELDLSERIVSEFEAALERGVGTISVGGHFVDVPVYDAARERLRLHQEVAGP